jgi:hypothetical protein
VRTGDYSNPNQQIVYISLDACDHYYMDLDGSWEHIENPDFCEDAPSFVSTCYTYDSCDIFKNEYLVYFDEDYEWDY